MSSDAVRVALRVRPQNIREQAASYQVCTSVLDTQIFIGNDKSFSYDYVFDRNSTQIEVYNACIKELVSGVFNGLNATVLAYGQTGSGKTHTMGTAFDAITLLPEFIGIIPRAVDQIFSSIVELKQEANTSQNPEPKFTIDVQFIELYNEELIDLLADDRSIFVKIHEEAETGQIVIKNAKKVLVNSADDVLDILKTGSLNRATGSTAMNQKSSRSHAIFSVHIKQEKFEGVGDDDADKIMTVLTAKLHFVDLAGSERLKRTGATGDRAKEGISINCGLLALGNVICALTDPKKSHVPYRDSKLTRLLQDSLGGNSRTLMIACASPNDVDFAETLNTMSYAARAKAIKNRVTVNKDLGTAIVGQLKARIAALENELNEYRQGKRMVNSGGEEMFSDQYNENVMLQSELNKYRVRAVALQETNSALSQRLIQLKEELERERLLKLAPKLDSEGNVDQNAQVEFETALSNMITTYVEDNEKMKLLLGETMSERDEYKKKYLNMKAMQEKRGYAAGGMIESSFTSFDENPLITSARKEVEDQRKLYEMLVEQNSNAAAHQTAGQMENESEDFVEDMEVDDEEENANDEDEILLAEREQQHAKIVLEVANLQDEISTKERLILELEQSERRMAQVRRDYERKLQELSERIAETESERDKILIEMSKKSNNKLSEDKVREVKQDYEKRLGTLRNDFNKMKTMQNEHERARQRQAAQQQELQRIRRELDDMKRSKVKLVQDMRENAKKVKKTETDLARKMATLEKNTRIKDNKIRTLQMRDQQREDFLKRKVDQMTALQQRQTRTPRNAEGRRRAVPLSISKKTYSPGVAKNKWKALEKKMNACINQHTGFSKLDEQHVRLLNEKVQVEKEATELDQKFVRAKTVEEREQIRDDMETNQHQLKYIDEQILDVRRALTDMECANKENDDNTEIHASMNTMIQQCGNLYEAHFLLEQMLQYAISKALSQVQSLTRVQSLEARIQESENENAVNERYITDLVNSSRRVNFDNAGRTVTILPGDTPKRDGMKSLSSAQKIRRRTATSNELLYDRMSSVNEYADQTKFIHPGKDDTFVATTIPEEDENRSSTSPLTESAATDIVKQYDEYLVTSLMHKDRVVAVDSSLNFVVTSSKDRVVRCWDLEQGKEVHVLSDNAKTATAVRFIQPNDPSMILCVFSFTAHLWDTRSSQVVLCMHSSGLIDKNRCGTSRVPASESNLAPFSFSADGNLLVSRYNESYRVWDIRNQKQLIKLDSLGSDQDVKSTAVYERAGYYGYLFTGRDNGDIQVDTVKPGFQNGTHVDSTTLIPSHNSRIISMFTTDKSLYSISRNGTLMKFSLVDLTRDLVENNTHSKGLNQACLLETANTEFDTVCTADTKGNLRVWSAENPNRLQMLYDLENAHGGSINGLCSTDEMLFSCSGDATVKCWKFNK